MHAYYSMFGEDQMSEPPKIKFKKKRFASSSRSRTFDNDDNDGTTSFTNVKSEIAKAKSKKSRWVKYSSLQATESVSNFTENASNVANLSGEGRNEQFNVDKESAGQNEEDDDPMVVDAVDTAVNDVDSLAAYVTVASNTFTLNKTYFKDALPTLKQEYDDDVEDIVTNPHPKPVDENDDIDIYDIEAYSEEKQAQINDDIYTYEIMSDASEDQTVKIRPVKVSSIDEIIAGLKNNIDTLKHTVLASQAELDTLKQLLLKAQTARADVLAQL